MPNLRGQCHCGSISYVASGDPVYHALCHCTDCRRYAGAPVVSWILYRQDQVAITGSTLGVYASSEHVRRKFCTQCGTALFYVNEKIFPGMIDIQSATLDHPETIPAEFQIQTADRISWMEHFYEMPQFERYPPPDDTICEKPAS